MSAVALAILTGVLMGIVFGFALEKSRVFEPGIIVGQMQLRNFIMLKIFLTAVATGAVVLAVLAGNTADNMPAVTLDGSAVATAAPGLLVDGNNKLLHIFGDAGIAARSALGVAELPLNSPVEVELTVEVA